MDAAKRAQLKQYYNEHVATHSEREAEDKDAVNALNSDLSFGGRIYSDFKANDKWPNHDGFFEFVPEPDVSRIPEQIFDVQIKGTRNYRESGGVISYSLTSLAFPAFIGYKVTSNPGILFIVLFSPDRRSHRLFWKHVSPEFINDIDFSKESATIHLFPQDEIKTDYAGMEKLWSKLSEIADNHLFLNNLDSGKITEEEALDIINETCNDLSQIINEVKGNVKLRDSCSKKMVRNLYSLCYATLVMNAIKLGYTDVSQQLAWRIAQYDPETRYLYDFLKGLKYIGIRIPRAGQSERLMLKYYSYLWKIRKFLKEKCGLSVLGNLEDFPTDTDTLNEQYYTAVADIIEKADTTKRVVAAPRYYIQNKMEKKIGSELYYELTLQLAGMYATKYNRITVFSKIDIDTDYSIQISYIERDLTLLGVNSKIKVLNNWKISIAPTCLNRIAKMVKVPSAISRKYGEYDSLMDYLTGTSANLLDIINSSDEDFAKIYDYIYKSAKTHIFGDVLIKLRRDYSFQASPVKNGKHTVRFALLSMKEEILESIMPRDNYYWMYDEPHICSKCKPFEYNPLVSNLTGTKSTKNYVEAVSEVVNNKTKVDCVKPYSTMETLTEETGELYFDIDKIGGAEAIINYNDSLDLWEKDNGYKINMDPSTNLAVIDSYERDTVNILGNLLGRSRSGNIERLRLNENYIRSKKAEITDINKEIALKYAFVYSGIMLIYGAAGTGKTTLLEYISDMMRGSSQLFLTKTHTALQNLKRRIGYHSNVEYSTIDSVAKSSIYVNSEIVFIDECSTIDNRTMIGAIGKMYNAKMIVMSGDIYQIESIDFGNWFYYAKDIIRAEGANVELLNNWRTDSPLLKALWDEVRNKKPTIEEKLSMDGDYSEELGEAIFKPIDEDEVVLCLNYDGVFGLNNINRYFQNANTSGREYTWDDWIFKTGDKILFLDTKRFELLYNNLKGKIVDIDKEDEKITFTIEVEAIFTSEQCAEEGIELVSITPNGKSVIRFDVIAWDDELTDEEKKKTVIPFQIAYAVSIHKAQGLEYNSVKVIIPSNNAEKITHSIFYTAITRAKKSLKIYWSSETMRDVIKSFTQEQVEQITLPIIESKLGITSTTAVKCS